MFDKGLLTMSYGLTVIGTGLWRSIEAQAYKPNSLWFCFVMGFGAIGAGFLYRLNKQRSALILAACVTDIVLFFYLYCFIIHPEKDATIRVGLAILLSIAELIVIFYPAQTQDHSPHYLPSRS